MDADDGSELRGIVEEEMEHPQVIAQTEIKKFTNDDAHLNPSRWWFASSAFPMIAGTLGPVASAFSICALVRPWRQRLRPQQDVQNAPFIDDPAWLTAINAVQLAVALVSNVFLLLNMARRVRFSIAQPITIVGWYISAICLLALNATAAGPLLDDVDFPSAELVWSQAYFYGIWAAILYFIDASLMVVTFYGASTGHYSKDFMLTPSQRTLMLQTILFLMYLLVGALIFSNIEGWNYLDSVYWADVTLFTVGFGDLHADTTLGRAFMIPYALIGVISLGLVIGSIRSLVLDRGKRHVDARMEEKKRRKLVRTMTRRGDDAILEPIRSNSAHSQSGRSDKLPDNEFDRRKAEFELMRQIQAQSSIRRRWMAMAISTGSWLILWLVGAVIFVKFEKPYQNWVYFDGFYFCFVTLTTIGYGDITPVSPGGKSFFVFWSLLALPTMTVLISNAGDTVVKFVRDSTLRLGNVTILPGEAKFSNDVKHILNKVTWGRVFPGHEEPPETRHAKAVIGTDRLFKEPSRKSEEPNPYQDNRGRVGHPHSNTEVERHSLASQGRTASTFTARVRRSLSRLRDPFDDLPTGTDFHFLLISEIQVVTKHLKESKAHKYSFDQWAWYLKLIGEDEGNAETHRKATPKVKHKQHRRHPNHTHNHNHNHNHLQHTDSSGDNVQCHDDEDENDLTTWSWVGNRSPLMGSQEESEWILDRLMDRLRESLSAERRRQLKMATRAACGDPSHRADPNHRGEIHRASTHHVDVDFLTKHRSKGHVNHDDLSHHASQNNHDDEEKCIHEEEEKRETDL